LKKLKNIYNKYQTIMAIPYVLMFIICVLLILVVLVQNSKGGGLAAGFTGSQIMGVRKTADFLEKATWTLAGTLILICIITNLIRGEQQVGNQKSVFQDREDIQNAITTKAAPKVPVALPKSNDSKTIKFPAGDKSKK
jgi:preprotein translocase subunit SecG